MYTTQACLPIPPTAIVERKTIPSTGPSVLNSLSVSDWRDNPISNKQQLLIASPPPHKFYNPIHQQHSLALSSEEADQLEDKVKSVSKTMMNLGGDSLEELIMIDTILRLGMDRLFQQEIMGILHRHYMEFYNLRSVDCCKYGLYEASLQFRLLRQQGYIVSTQVFDGFLSRQDMKFNEELGMDTQSIVSLFEASEMRIQGEYILDEANLFSKRILYASMERLYEPHMLQVQHALKHPFQKTLTRFTAPDFLGTLSGGRGWRDELQFLAKMEFNSAKVLYHKEILHISSWWKELGLAKELEFARNQPQKWHMCSLAMLSDPILSEQRTELTKAISFIYVIDDIFDVYGNLEELTIFTEVVNRWEYERLETLPHCMKICLKALFDVTEETSHQIWLKYGFNPKDSLRKVWTNLINNFLVEFKWFAAGYVPTTTEYLSVATITSGVHVVLANLYYLVGGESDTCVFGKELSGITTSTAMILRLWDDLGDCEAGDKDEHEGSYIKCYMKEHKGVSIEDARKHVDDLISEAWKNLNQESMKSPSYLFSSRKVFTKGCLDLARMTPLMYTYDENQNLPDLDNFVTSLLYQKY